MPTVVATLQALVGVLRVTIAEQRTMIVRLDERARDLETRLRQYQGNTSVSPSSYLPGTPKCPPSRPGGWGNVGQRGHVADQMFTAPPGRVDLVTDYLPLKCQASRARLTVLPRAR